MPTHGPEIPVHVILGEYPFPCPSPSPCPTVLPKLRQHSDTETETDTETGESAPPETPKQRECPSREGRAEGKEVRRLLPVGPSGNPYSVSGASYVLVP
jgi:hypothetical protein